MQHHPIALKTMPALPHHIADALIERIRKGHMHHEPVLKERMRPDPLCSVDDLIRHHEVARLDFFGETAGGAERDDTSHAEFAQGGDVGARGDFRRVEFVVRAVAGNERDGDLFARRGRRVFEDGDRAGRRSPGRVDRQNGRLVEVREVVEAGAADHGDVDGACCSRQMLRSGYFERFVQRFVCQVDEASCTEQKHVQIKMLDSSGPGKIRKTGDGGLIDSTSGMGRVHSRVAQDEWDRYGPA